MPLPDAVRAAAAEVLRAYAVPGIVISVSRHGRPVESLALGTDAAGEPLAVDSLIPVASITKLATALTVLRLIADGRLALDDALARHLPDAAAARDGVTIRTMLCHTAGLPDDLASEDAPYRPGLDWPGLARACLATPHVIEPRTRVAYSNVGPGLLAVAVERLTGEPFRVALTDLVLEPLGIEGYLGVEPPRRPARIAGRLGEHEGTDLEPYNSSFWRSLALPWGGLVTTALGALSLVRAFAGEPSGFLPAPLLAEATRDQTGGLPGGMGAMGEGKEFPWGLGVELRGRKLPHSAPAEASASSFGHAGASGTLAWADPERDVAWAMLGTHTFESWWKQWPAIGSAIMAATG